MACTPSRGAAGMAASSRAILVLSQVLLPARRSWRHFSGMENPVSSFAYAALLYTLRCRSRSATSLVTVRTEDARPSITHAVGHGRGYQLSERRRRVLPPPRGEWCGGTESTRSPQGSLGMSARGVLLGHLNCRPQAGLGQNERPSAPLWTSVSFQSTQRRFLTLPGLRRSIDWQGQRSKSGRDGA
jgi:hypothetical protein